MFKFSHISRNRVKQDLTNHHPPLSFRPINQRITPWPYSAITGLQKLSLQPAVDSAHLLRPVLCWTVLSIPIHHRSTWGANHSRSWIMWTMTSLSTKLTLRNISSTSDWIRSTRQGWCRTLTGSSSNYQVRKAIMYQNPLFTTTDLRFCWFMNSWSLCISSKFEN